MIMVSLNGLVIRAARNLRQRGGDDGRYYAHSLEELLGNLRELRNRTNAGDTTAIDEFFALYKFDDAPAKVAP